MGAVDWKTSLDLGHGDFMELIEVKSKCYREVLIRSQNLTEVIYLWAAVDAHQALSAGNSWLLWEYFLYPPKP